MNDYAFASVDDACWRPVAATLQTHGGRAPNGAGECLVLLVTLWHLCRFSQPDPPTIATECTHVSLGQGSSPFPSRRPTNMSTSDSGWPPRDPDGPRAGDPVFPLGLQLAFDSRERRHGPIACAWLPPPPHTLTSTMDEGGHQLTRWLRDAATTIPACEATWGGSAAGPRVAVPDPHEAHGVGAIVKALAQQNAGASLILRAVVCIVALLCFAHSTLVLGGASVV